MDFHYAHYMVTGGRKGKENPNQTVTYQEELAEVFNMNGTQILAFKSKPPMPVELIPREFFATPTLSKPAKPRCHIPQTSDRTLDAPDLVDDYYLNLLNWGSSNVLAIALAITACLWDASNGPLPNWLHLTMRMAPSQVSVGLLMADTDVSALTILMSSFGIPPLISRVVMSSLSWKRILLSEYKNMRPCQF